MESYLLKTWELSGYLAAEDYEYIQGCSVRFESGKTESKEVYSANGQRYYVGGRSHPATVVTQTVDQESALLLKYCGRLHLTQTVHVTTTSIAV